MSHSGRRQLFDHWAENYDATVTRSGGEFPFDGYEQVLDTVVRLAGVEPQMRILELGIGTGNLAARLVRRGCTLWGIDFSPNMLAKAHAQVPQATLLQADLLGDWPPALRQPFDRVVSAYLFHEFDLETKLGLLRRIASQHLSAGGRIVIADVAFPTVAARAAAQQEAGGWDEDEYYWAADEAMAAMEQAGLQAAYEQVSSCGGVFTVTIRRAG
jgi:putative AdoMet-dependent methyltransferase